MEHRVWPEKSEDCTLLGSLTPTCCPLGTAVQEGQILRLVGRNMAALHVPEWGSLLSLPCLLETRGQSWVGDPVHRQRWSGAPGTCQAPALQEPM